MATTNQTGQAIILGGSIGGLLAARVLSESYEKVTVFDRDELPAEVVDRKGVPQSGHSHGLLARGRQILEEFFPGLTADLTSQGAVAIDLQRDCLWVNDGHRIPRVASGLEGLCVSRRALEAYVRDRVRALPNVEIRDRCEALGLLADGGAVVGARVLPRGGREERHDADLVVDATGRGNRGPTWLAELGYQPPVEDRVDPRTVYVSRDYRRTPGDADFAAFVSSPSPDAPRGGVAIAAEGDRWMVTLLGVGPDQAPPTDPEGYLAFTAWLPAPELHALLSRAEPLGPPKRMRLPTSVRRRYEHLARLPEGFIAVADAMCSFNPAYGQGMTVAAAEAMVLRDCLRQGRKELPRRFFAGAAKVVDVPWDMAVGADLRHPTVVGPRSRRTRFLNGYVTRLHAAAARHPVVGRRFLSVANLMTPPPGLFAPGIVARVLWSGRRTTPHPVHVEPAARVKELAGR
ncbi:monooxygenase, FAD-binding [Micromonospora sp. ATCC 39149]|uniref:FAD-binding protein n=1 Tax=Micromonospora carbonacea TaxID=47853 RepID=A0A7D5YF61_9ACTN|nr:FAD-binding protein [Micromonospora sp. ATCC 39149]EEP72764.1 monooxygenase, FAD-binding [Micromonospora sp. ATCC 39149]QLJ98855.1 FAD-binding protein [Micromonospora carbonacea]